MKILYLNSNSGLGGAERVLLQVMNAVRRAAPSFELCLVLPEEGKLAARARDMGVMVRTVAMPASLAMAGDSGLEHQIRLSGVWRTGVRYAQAASSMLPFVAALRATIRDLNPNLVHSNGIKHHLLGALTVQRDVPLVWHVHDFWTQRRVAAPLLRLASKRVQAMIAISNAVAEDASRVAKAPKSHVVYNAIDIDEFSTPAEDGSLLDELAEMPRASAETVRIGLVGTYARWKGHELFLRAAREAIRLNPLPMRFYVVGGPVYQTQGSQYTEKELRELVGSLGISDAVGFIPFCDDVAPMFRALDVVVNASTRPEPFGLTIVEGMAAAKPVIAAGAGGAIELFSHGDDGLCTVPGDVDALAASMVQLAKNPETRKRLGRRAQETARQRFSNERLGPQILEVYRSVMS